MDAVCSTTDAWDTLDAGGVAVIGGCALEPSQAREPRPRQIDNLTTVQLIDKKYILLLHTTN